MAQRRVVKVLLWAINGYADDLFMTFNNKLDEKSAKRKSDKNGEL